ncbi:MAG: histidinol-phosphatase, partial [Bacteroidota bacterium]
ERYFSEKSPWYQSEVMQTLEVIAKAGIILEVNTKGYYNKVVADTYPSHWILGIARELGIPVQIGSDAHKPRHIIAGFEYAMDSLQKLGFRSTRIMWHGRWQDVPLEELALLPVG